MTTPTRVLVVDDEPNVRRTLADILRGVGCDVATANDGETAVKLCGRGAYDAVLMDVRMPGIDGVEALKRIRRNGNDVPVILMSAYTLAQMERSAMEHGALAFLRKPLDVQRVIELIDNAGSGDQAQLDPPVTARDRTP